MPATKGKIQDTIKKGASKTKDVTEEVVDKTKQATTLLAQK